MGLKSKQQDEKETTKLNNIIGKKKRSDVANEVVAIEKNLGIKNDLLVKSNMYSIVGLILICCGLSVRLFVIFGVISEIFSIKIMLSKECKRQKLWHKCIVSYVKGMYNETKKFCLEFDEEEKKSQAYKMFIKMFDKTIAKTAH